MKPQTPLGIHRNGLLAPGRLVSRPLLKTCPACGAHPGQRCWTSRLSGGFPVHRKYVHNERRGWGDSKETR